MTKCEICKPTGKICESPTTSAIEGRYEIVDGKFQGINKESIKDCSIRKSAEMTSKCK
jgi:hypothetical protein